MKIESGIFMTRLKYFFDLIPMGMELMCRYEYKRKFIIILKLMQIACALTFISPAHSQGLDGCKPYVATQSSGGGGLWGYSVMEVCQQLAQPGPNTGWWHSGLVNGGRDYRTVSILGVTPEGNCRADVKTVNVQTGQTNLAETGVYYYEGVAKMPCTPYVDDPKTQKPPSCPADPSVGDPIFPLTGAERFTQPLPVKIGWETLSLTFDSTRRLPSAQGNLPVFPKPYDILTELWETNVHKRIISMHFKRGAHALRGKNQIVTFKLNDHGSFASDPDTSDVLSKTPDGFRYFDMRANTIESYDAEGYILRVDRSDGRHLVYTNSNSSLPGYPLSIQDESGRMISFSYEGSRLVKVLDAAGQSVSFIVDSNNQKLDGVEWQDGKKVLFPYAPSLSYYSLAGVIDENGARHATITYDAGGRAVSSELAGGVDRHEVTYQTPPIVKVTESGPVEGDPTPFAYRQQLVQVPEGTSVRLPGGATSSWAAYSLSSAPTLSSRSQPSGSGCAASANAISFDYNRNVASRDDFNQIRTCYLSDHRNLETIRVEGLAVTASCSSMTGFGAVLPAGSRKISTAWHPDWRLETRRAEPGRLTTSVYNGQLDPFTNAVASCAPATAKLPTGKPIVVLCKRVEQATTDVDGSKSFTAVLQAAVPDRQTTWTYNEYGQVLTEDGPRTDVADITRYAYYTDTTTDHTLGDLKSVTNAAGKVKNYTRYNKHGQVLESVDANNVVTVNTYDLRQRLLSSSVDGQTTRYTYDAVGQLKRITQPDTSWIGYDHDDAHRLVAVHDHKGNRISYTLDNAGNRIGEEVKDPGGVLKRQLTRTIDALGRVQQTTGWE